MKLKYPTRMLVATVEIGFKGGGFVIEDFHTFTIKCFNDKAGIESIEWTPVSPNTVMHINVEDIQYVQQLKFTRKWRWVNFKDK